MTACAPVPPAEPVEEPVPVHGQTGYICDAAKAGGLIGRPASSALGSEALRLSGARTLRWIRPGDAVTMDYREDRLNIHLDGRSQVMRISCG